MQIIHYLQMYVSGRFRQFDWGKSRNLEAYGTTDPPEYNVTEVTVPVAVFYSNGDALLSKVDVQLLLKKLPNILFTKFFDDNQWNHFDYLLAKTVQEDINYVIIGSLDGF